MQSSAEVPTIDRRPPPHNQEAEQSVLGACLVDGKVAPLVRTLLTAEHFYEDRHARIFEAIQTVDGRGEPVDLTTVSGELELSGKLPGAGGLSYLARLAGSVPVTANVEAYARMVLERHRLRQVRDAGRLIYARAHDGSTADEAVATATEAVFGLMADGAAEPDQDPVEWFDQAMSTDHDLERTYTGLEHLDALYVMRPGHVTVLGGPTNQGKTALALQLALNIALGDDKSWPPRDPERVYVWSGEMRRRELYERIAANIGELSLSDIIDRTLEDRQKAAGRAAMERVKAAPLVLDDKPARLAELEARVRLCAIQQGPIALVVIDYLSLLSDLNSEDAGDGERRDLQVGSIVWRCKQLAMQIQCHVLLLHQLNRAYAARSTGRPRLSDLRDSSQIEQHAYGVLLVYQPSRDDGQDADYKKRCLGLLELNVAKQRQGQTDSIWLQFLAGVQRVRTWHRDRWPVSPEPKRRKGKGA